MIWGIMPYAYNLRSGMVEVEVLVQGKPSQYNMKCAEKQPQIQGDTKVRLQWEETDASVGV